MKNIRRHNESSMAGQLRSFSFFSAMSKFLIGIWLLNPYIDTFATSRSYRAMSDIMSEVSWGWVFFLSGSIHLLTMVFGLTRFVLYVVMYSSAFLWFFLTVLFFQVNPGGLGTPVFGAITLSVLMNILGVQYKSDEEEERGRLAAKRRRHF